MPARQPAFHHVPLQLPGGTPGRVVSDDAAPLDALLQLHTLAVGLILHHGPHHDA